MGEKEELIGKIRKTAEEKGFSVVIGLLKKKSIPELEEELQRIEKMPVIHGAEAKGGELKLITKEKQEPVRRGEPKPKEVEPTNPFNIPRENKEAKKWMENNLGLILSERFREWAYSPEGKRFLHQQGSISFELLEVLKTVRKKVGGVEGIEKEFMLKRPKIRNMEELDRYVKEIKKFEEELKKKEAETPGFLEIRKKAIERMNVQKEKLRKRRR